LDEFLCYPVDSGKKVRTYNLLRHLATRHRIILLCFVWGDAREKEGIDHLRSIGIEVVTVTRGNPIKSGAAFYWKLFANLFSPLPYIVAGHLSSSYRQRLAQLVIDAKPDVLLAEWSPYAIYLKEYSRIPRVAVAHNIESSIWRGYVEKSESWARRAYVSLQYRKVTRFERQIFGWLDGLITVSPIEQEQVQKAYSNLKVALVDNGVDTEYFAPSPSVPEECLVSFTGSMDWRPNQDGVEYFIRTVLPLLRAKVPEVKLLIIGRQPPDWLITLGKEHGVEFTGSVPDVRPDVRRTAVSIVPLRIGGGSRLKILEALAMEKAVVSTTLGAEGLAVISGKHLLIADEPEAFAVAVARLLQNQDERRRLGIAGRALVTEKYQWDRLATTMSGFLEEMVSAR
jgi:sugar transferase (PEP-CTERM/EpsH1 system associated)